VDQAEPKQTVIDVAVLNGRHVISNFYGFKPVLQSPSDLTDFPFAEQKLEVAIACFWRLISDAVLTRENGCKIVFSFVIPYDSRSIVET